MFGFFENKKIDEKNIKRFNNAIKAIKAYISSWLFKKALIACEEIVTKEKEALEHLVKSKKDSPIKEDIDLIKKETKIFETRQKQVEVLKEKARVLEIKYREKIKVERFKKNFKAVKKEIRNLIKLWKPLDAMNHLKYFLEQNKDRTEVINFYNREKKVVQKALDRQKKELRKKMKDNARAEAMNLIWKKDDDKKEENGILEKTKSGFLSWFKSSKNELLKKIEEEKTLEEVNKLIEQDKEENEEMAKIKLENIHKWLIKELKYNSVAWFDIYGKILWADKISGDVFSIDEKDESHKFFLWDATWHWVKAWLIVTLLNKNFRKFKDKSLKEMVFNINNALKQSLESKNFITWAFFEISKKDYSVSYVWMWHEPIIFYNNETKKVEKKWLGWLAAWIRIMKDINSVKTKKLEMQDWDIFVILSDWIIEAKNEYWKYYSLERVEKSIKLAADSNVSLREIYEYIMNDLKLFKWWTKFDDDATILIVKRDKTKDIVEEESYLKKIIEKEWLTKKEAKELMKWWDTKEWINKKIKEIKRKKEIERIVKILETTYYNWEILKLKQDAIRYVKDWFIDKRINFYLKKAIENEKKYKIDQKEQKVRNKFMVLEALYKKWNFDTVIKEVEDIIAKDWA